MKISSLTPLALDLPLIVVGFSFGSLCGIRHAIDDSSVTGVVAIGLPVNRSPIPDVAALRRPFAVVQASADEFGTPAEVRAEVAQADPVASIHVVEGTTHLFPGRAPDAAAAVVAAADTMLDAPR